MMNQNNPYQSSTVDLSKQLFQDSGQQGLVATPHALSKLFASKGWVRLISVMIFIYVGILCIVGLYILGSGAAGMMHLGAVVMLLLFIFVVIMFILGLRLSKYASAMNRLRLSNHQVDFEAAMVAQMKYWSLAGIMSVLYIVISVFQFIFS